MTGSRLVASLHVTLALLLLSPALPSPAFAQNDPPAAGPEVPKDVAELVETYFRLTNSRERARIAKRIAKMEAATFPVVAASIRQTTSLWPSQEPGVRDITNQLKRRTPGMQLPKQIHVAIPPEYDAARAYPLLIALPGEQSTAAEFLPFAMNLLGDRLDAFIVVAPEGFAEICLNATVDASMKPAGLIEALKRELHVDTDRIYACGYSLGGHAAMTLAALHPDLIAGAICLAGMFAHQLGPEAAALMLPNLRHVPALVVYGAQDRAHRANEFDDATGIATWNRYLGQAARRLSVPIEMIEIPGAGHDGITPPPGRLNAILDAVRPHGPRPIDHWFRFPGQGRTAWLRQTRFAGEPWAAQQIVVAPAVDETASQAVTALLKEKLAFVGGAVDGQTIRIQSRHSARVAVLLNDEVVDLDKDITIFLDDARRFEGRAKRKIRTMLEVAFDDWEFQRLWPVRFDLSQRGRAVQD